MHNIENTYNNKVDKRDSIERNVPPVHQAHQINNDHDDGKSDDGSRVQVESQEEEYDDEDGKD